MWTSRGSVVGRPVEIYHVHCEHRCDDEFTSTEMERARVVVVVDNGKRSVVDIPSEVGTIAPATAFLFTRQQTLYVVVAAVA